MDKNPGVVKPGVFPLLFVVLIMTLLVLLSRKVVFLSVNGLAVLGLSVSVGNPGVLLR